MSRRGWLACALAPYALPGSYRLFNGRLFVMKPFRDRDGRWWESWRPALEGSAHGGQSGLNPETAAEAGGSIPHPSAK